MRRRDLLRAAAAAALPASVAAAEARVATGSALDFGRGFVWGASTSAYQIEGAANDDGRGVGIWDAFARSPGRIEGGASAAVACDHYHRYAEDVEWLVRGGFGAYRFSTSWPRIQPVGAGPVNGKGIDFYDRLVDLLSRRGVTPWLCLYHWDLPQALQERGGWLDRDTAARFADYAGLVALRLGDRVRHWIVLNEAMIQGFFGYGLGTHAPGLRGRATMFAAIHHLNLAQGLAIQALRAARTGLEVGTALCLEPVRPSSAREPDRIAARRFDGLWNGSTLDPLLRGAYPADLAADIGPFQRPEDAATIRQPVDFLGLNYYSRVHVQADPASPIGAHFGPLPAHAPHTIMGWPIEPDGLHEQLLALRDDYGNPPIYITENGVASGQAEDDADRIAYLEAHLAYARQAKREGANLRGYFVWTLLDCFEWNDGMRHRFGLIHVDFASLRRTPKRSFHWLAQVIATQRDSEPRASRLTDVPSARH